MINIRIWTGDRNQMTDYWFTPWTCGAMEGAIRMWSLGDNHLIPKYRTFSQMHVINTYTLNRKLYTDILKVLLHDNHHNVETTDMGLFCKICSPFKTYFKVDIQKHESQKCIFTLNWNREILFLNPTFQEVKDSANQVEDEMHFLFHCPLIK